MSAEQSAAAHRDRERGKKGLKQTNRWNEEVAQAPCPVDGPAFQPGHRCEFPPGLNQSRETSGGALTRFCTAPLIWRGVEERRRRGDDRAEPAGIIVDGSMQPKVEENHR